MDFDRKKYESLLKYIETRDKQLVKAGHYAQTELLDTLIKLQKFGFVNVGGRASCGGKVDKTWLIFTKWNEIVKKANSIGMSILVEDVKQKNAYATISGGFWHENKYSIKVA